MKMRLLLALVGLAISFAAPTFAQQKDTIDSQTAQQIRALGLKYDEAMNNHDASAVAAFYYTQHAVRMTNYMGTYQGLEDIEKSYTNYDFHQWQISNYLTTVERVFAVGAEVRAYGTWTCVGNDSDGNAQSYEGRFSWVFVREGYAWKIFRNTSSVAKSGGGEAF